MGRKGDPQHIWEKGEAFEKATFVSSLKEDRKPRDIMENAIKNNNFRFTHLFIERDEYSWYVYGFLLS